MLQLHYESKEHDCLTDCFSFSGSYLSTGTVHLCRNIWWCSTFLDVLSFAQDCDLELLYFQKFKKELQKMCIQKSLLG